MIWPFQNNRTGSQRRLALQLASGQLLAVVCTEDGVLSSTRLAAPGGEPDLQALASFVDANQLAGARTTVLMGLGSYQMLLVEAPPVEPAELAEALKWKVRDLLAQPLEQSLVDGFLLPQDAFRGRQKMAYAVATPREQLQSLVDALLEAGLEIETVTIGETSLLPLFARLDQHPALVLVVGEAGGFLSMVADNAIYLVRKLDTGHTELAGETTRQRAVEKLVLEIQRSRDYFESQMGKGVINRMLMFPTHDAIPELDAALQQQLGLPVEFFPLAHGEELETTEQCLLSAVLSAA